jgi:hypothetical protein
MSPTLVVDFDDICGHLIRLVEAYRGGPRRSGRASRNLGRVGFRLKRQRFSSVSPAKAGIQSHPEPLVGFTWAPAFAGKTEI